MKEIGIAKILVSKRKEKGVTQDELANYIGVSKASVSKWETGQSYPDITLLPRLAAYFNISIDDLMGYEPQLTKADIRKLYHKLTAEFSSAPVDEVMVHCREIVKKYYACFPLLLQMGMLLVNHSALAESPDKTASLLAEAKELFIRVKRESTDVALAKQALYMEANCRISLGEPDAALELLEGAGASVLLPVEALLSAAYRMTGENAKAKAALQIGMYQYIVSLFAIFPAYLSLSVNEGERYEEVLRRAFAIAEAFDLRRLHPSLLINLYIAAAQGYIALGRNEAALSMLQKYAQLVTGDIYPLRLHGDDFFDLVDEWLAESGMGTAPPRSEKTVRRSMADMVVNNPAFSALAHERRFQGIVADLNNNC